MRFVVALSAWIVTWVMVLPVALAAAVVAALFNAVTDGLVSEKRPLVILFAAAWAGAGAWVAARIVSAVVERHADGRFGSEPIVTATAVALLSVVLVDVVPWAMLVSFAAAFAATFIPWQPRRPSVAGALVGTATLTVILLAIALN